MSAAKDKTRGTVNEVAGKMKQAAGAATGNESLRAEGEGQQVQVVAPRVLN